MKIKDLLTLNFTQYSAIITIEGVTLHLRQEEFDFELDTHGYIKNFRIELSESKFKKLSRGKSFKSYAQVSRLVEQISIFKSVPFKQKQLVANTDLRQFPK